MEGVGHETDAHGPKQAQPPLERAIAELASAQHAVVSLSQLEALGLGARAVSHRVQRGMLHRVHRGVYAVGHPLLTREGRWMAAVLACGPNACLSHRSAASLWGVRSNDRSAIDVVVPSRAGRMRDGIDVHRGGGLAPADRTTLDAIPCTSLARTLLDLAEVVGARGLERAIERAEILRLLDMRPIDDVLRRAGGRRGAGALRAVLAEIEPGSTLTRSELEERFLQICRDAALPAPEIGAWISHPGGGGAEADFAWRDQRLIVDVDGRDVHTTRRAFEHDRRRDQRLMLAGWRVVRFTWRQVVHEPAAVAETVRALLAQAA
jgi:predicted transcriptional regulator of viral defense system